MVTLVQIGVILCRMDEIRALCGPGVKLAVIVRSPGHPDHDLLLTDDEPAELAAPIARRIAADAAPAPSPADPASVDPTASAHAAEFPEPPGAWDYQP